MQKRKSNRRLTWTILTALAILALVMGFYSQYKSNSNLQQAQLKNGSLLPSPMSLTEFNLIDDSGKSFTNQNLEGHWNLLFFGFTHCQMLCPTTLAELNKAYQLLSKSWLEKNGLSKGVSEKENSLPQIVFISVDPERDTPKKIQKYLKQFNHKFVGVTGTSEQIAEFTKQTGIAYLKATKSNDKDYDIDHSGTILVINPKGEWVAVFNAPHQGEIMANDFVRIQKYFE